jgi:lysophospholipase L1-like esterase
VLFPVTKVLAVRSSAGDVTYEEGRDYHWKPGSREIVLTADSRIPSRTPQELRRPAGSQPYQLTHRDGEGEILFGAKLEYHDMQTCISYSHEPLLWRGSVPKFDERVLPRVLARLKARKPCSLVVLGDSISAGANASAVGDGPPYQPAYPELFRRHLAEQFQAPVTLTNLSVGGRDSQWGTTMIDQIAGAKPDLLVIAFGMNDAAGRPAKEFQGHIETILKRVRERAPDCEYILVATMLGNPDWVRLKQNLFAEYQESLAGLCGPGVALADLTGVWTEFLKLKKDWDQTGNGVNHPNDFGHRVYAQVLSRLLIPPSNP